MKNTVLAALFLVFFSFCLPKTVLCAVEGKKLCVWGQAVEVDASKGELKVKYIDPDTANERVSRIKVDQTTVYNNVSGLSEINTGDDIYLEYYFDISGSVAAVITVDNSDGIKESVFSQDDITFQGSERR